MPVLSPKRYAMELFRRFRPVCLLTGWKGNRDVTALEVATWAYRLGAYVHTLRHRHGLSIETRRELHEGGWHGRYVLCSPVAIGEAVQ